MTPADARAADSETAAVDPDEPRWSVAVVARQLGVAPPTLRTWARRYGLGPSSHASGAHRRYSAEDVERLLAVRRLIFEGVAPGDAARLVLAGHATGRPPVAEPVATVAPSPPVAAAPNVRPAARSGPAPSPRGLARAAIALDSAAVTAMLTQATEQYGVIEAWERLMRPVLVAAGRRWARMGTGVDVEHLLSECAIGVLRAVPRPSETPRLGRPVLLACVETDQHSLPLHALAAALAEQGVESHLLGAAVPTTAIASAVRRTGPSAVFIWAQFADSGASHILDELPVTRPRATMVTGGPGWEPTSLPANARHAAGLREARDLLTAASRG